MTDSGSSQPQFNQPQDAKPGMSTGKKAGLGCGLLVLLSLLGGCAALIGVAALVGDDEPTGSANPPTSTTAPKIFEGRADSQPQDIERNVGEAAEFSGYTTTVNSAEFQEQVSEFETDGYLVGNVTVQNRDQRAQSYSTFDWQLLTPAGTVIDPTYTSAGGELGSADLVNGGEVSGTVTFEVGSTKGDYYLIYKPDPFDAVRGVWKVTI